MDLYLRKVTHPEARKNYRVLLKDDGDEIELGSIGIRDTTDIYSAWHWGIDTVIPMRSIESEGNGKDRDDCMARFREAWQRFAADEANLMAFLDAKKARRR